MGLLSSGEPLTWEETKKYADFIKEHGIQQFINVYNRHRHVKRDCLRWGDEIEYLLLKFDRKNKKVCVNLCGSKLIPVLTEQNVGKSDWKPEYADYMLEGTPFLPYGGQTRDFATVEENMVQRRKSVEALLGRDEAVITIPSFPRLGLAGFIFPEVEPTPADSVSASLFFPDVAIFPAHPRFGLLTKNIRSRRGRKISINIPVYRDVKTEDPFFVEDLSQYNDKEAMEAAKPNHVYMDAMGFGMGLCCLQVTFQAVDINEARLLYDQLANICPIMMALSAGTPVLRGTLTATDTRWQVISAAVDDRTREESGEEPQKTARFRFFKSRYDSIDSYLSPMGEPFSDLDPFVVEPGLMARLTEGGVDRILAKHMAHLFCRDPLTIYRERLNQDDAVDTDHFENIQSTNWQTLRFKPPPPQPLLDPAHPEYCERRIGWRVEFRPMEIQITDFENAALTVFIVLLTRAILSFRLNFIIPLSRVDENLRRGHLMDSIRKEKFYFRTNIFTDNSPEEARKCCVESTCDDGDGKHGNCSPEEIRIANQDCRVAEMTIDEIINGGDEFFGLVPLIRSYLDSIDCEVSTRRKVSIYLDLIAGRASGRYKTNARWMRDFIINHPDYKQDSRVSDSTQFDLLEKIVKISHREILDETLLPPGALIQRHSSPTASLNNAQSSVPTATPVISADPSSAEAQKTKKPQLQLIVNGVSPQ